MRKFLKSLEEYHDHHRKECDIVTNDDLYAKIDEEDEMTDQEKREAYFAEYDPHEDETNYPSYIPEDDAWFDD